MLKLAFRNVTRHKLRTGMTVAAIVFGVVGLVLSGGFVQDLYHKLGEALIHSQSGHLQVSRSGFHAHGTRSPEKFLIDEPESIKKVVRELPGIDDVMARINFSGLINNGRNDWPAVGEGVEPAAESRLGSHLRIVEGRTLAEGDAYGVLIGEGVAHALQLRTGDSVTLLLNTAKGALNTVDFEVVGVFQSFSKDYDAHAIKIPINAAHELLDTRGANSIVVSLKRTEDTHSVASAISRQIDTAGYEVKTWEQLNDFYASTVALYERQFGVIQLIILVLVLLSVANSVNMSVFERVGEFGTMMALGNRSRMIFQLVITENALLGLGGALLGAVLGVLLAAIISAVGIPMPPPPNANVGYTAHIRVLPLTVVTACAVGFIATALASIVPAGRVARKPLVDALARNH